MLRQEIEEKVMAAIKKNRRGPAMEITPQTTFEELKMESLEVVCTVFDLEDAFNIDIPDDAARSMRCVGDVVEGVTRAIESPVATPAPAVEDTH